MNSVVVSLVLCFVFLSVCGGTTLKGSNCNSCKGIIDITKLSPTVCEDVCPLWKVENCKITCDALRTAISTSQAHPCTVAGLCDAETPLPASSFPKAPSPSSTAGDAKLLEEVNRKLEELLVLERQNNMLLQSLNVKGKPEESLNEKYPHHRIFQEERNVEPEKESEVVQPKGSRYIVFSNTVAFVVAVVFCMPVYLYVLNQYRRDERKTFLVENFYQLGLIVVGFIVLREVFVFLITLGTFPKLSSIIESIWVKNGMMVTDKFFSTLVALFLGSSLVLFLHRSILTYKKSKEIVMEPSELSKYYDILLSLIILTSSSFCATETTLLVLSFLLPPLLAANLPHRAATLALLGSFYKLRVLLTLNFADSWLAFAFYIVLVLLQLVEAFWRFAVFCLEIAGRLEAMKEN